MAKNSKEKERFEVLLEELKSEFRHVAERITALDAKIDREIQSFKESLEQRIGLLEKAVAEGFRSMHQQFGEVRSDIHQLRERLDAHEQAHMRG